ncbi:MAG: SDR family oxidoreductase [Almyronema sp.]
MKAFVTGSTGLLGSNLVRLLVEQGHRVKALVRSPEKALRLFGDLDVELVKGDMLDLEGFVEELQSCDVLFHTAAYFRESFQPGEHWQKLEEINITATINLLRYAKQYQLKKVVYVSSAGVIGKLPDGTAGNESTPPHPITYQDPYFRSKLFAEKAIDAFLAEHPLEVTLILPGWMFGPGDVAPTSSGQFVLDYVNRKLPILIDGGACIVDARDTAIAMIKAATLSGRSGERYIVGGHYYSLEDLCKALTAITGVPLPGFRLPHRLLMAYAWISERYSQVTHRPILISCNGARNLYAKLKWNSDKAVQELGIAFRPMEEMLQDQVNWYRQHHYL